MIRHVILNSAIALSLSAFAVFPASASTCQSGGKNFEEAEIVWSQHHKAHLYCAGDNRWRYLSQWGHGLETNSDIQYVGDQLRFTSMNPAGGASFANAQGGVALRAFALGDESAGLTAEGKTYGGAFEAKSTEGYAIRALNNTGGALHATGKVFIDGRVGVGTDYPHATLHIKNGSGASIINPGRSRTLFAIETSQTTDGSNSFVISNGNGVPLRVDTRGGVYIDASHGRNAGTQVGILGRVNINNSAIYSDFDTRYVGIRTSVPRSSLEVNGGIRARMGAPAGGDSQSIVGYAFGSDGDTGMFAPGNAVPNNGMIGFYSNGTEVVRIANGRLGIGVSAPTQSLQVDGHIDVTNNRILRVATPTAATDAANKAYVDTLGNRTCSNGQILKFQSGAWACAGDNSGGGADNLGNHTATQTLNMAGNVINAASSINISSAEDQARGISVIVGEATQARGIHVSASGSQASGIYASATGSQSTGIQTSGELRGVQATATGTGARAVYGIATTTSGASYGVFGQSTASSSGRGVQGTGGYVGVYGQAATDQGRGVVGQGGLYGVEGTGASTVAGSAGGYFISTNATGYGVRAVAIQSTGVNYGIWASSQSPEGFGVYGNNGWNTGYGVYCNTMNPSGCGGNRAWTNASDGRLKHHVTDLATENGLAAILKLRPVTYQWRTEDSGRIELGFIAQDVEDVLPELVGTSPDTTITLADGTEQEIANVKSLSYSGFVVPLVKAVQELKAENDSLRADLQAANDNFRRELDELKAAIDE